MAVWRATGPYWSSSAGWTVRCSASPRTPQRRMILPAAEVPPLVLFRRANSPEPWRRDQQRRRSAARTAAAGGIRVMVTVLSHHRRRLTQCRLSSVAAMVPQTHQVVRTRSCSRPGPGPRFRMLLGRPADRGVPAGEPEPLPALSTPRLMRPPAGSVRRVLPPPVPGRRTLARPWPGSSARCE